MSDDTGGATLASATRTVQSPWRTVTASPWFHLALAFVVVGLILSFVAKPFVVPSGSMRETLSPGDRILVLRLATLVSAPESGDIVVFTSDESWSEQENDDPDAGTTLVQWLGETTGFGPPGARTLVKRVVATPGQTTHCCDASGRIVIDGASVNEPYVTDDFPFTPGTLDCASIPRSLRCFDDVTVPADAYLMLGDDRANSSDSAALCRNDGLSGTPPACWRWAHRSDIVGKTIAIIWPVSRWRGF